MSDPEGIVALGLETLSRQNTAMDLAALAELIEQYGAREVILGRPLSKSGGESEMSQRAAGFAEKLRERCGCAVRLWDERLSTAEAHRVLRGAGLGLSKRQRAIDRVSATLILQNYLDWRAYERKREGDERKRAGGNDS